MWIYDFLSVLIVVITGHGRCRDGRYSMKRGCESVMPIGGGHGGGLLSVLVVMGHIVTARLTPLWEGSNHFVPTVENVFVEKSVTTYDAWFTSSGKTRTISAMKEVQ
jgi:hypothetical protein